MATKKNVKKTRKPKTPLRVILVRVLAIVLAAMMVVTVAYYLFPVFSYTAAQFAAVPVDLIV